MLIFAAWQVLQCQKPQTIIQEEPEPSPYFFTYECCLPSGQGGEAMLALRVATLWQGSEHTAVGPTSQKLTGGSLRFKTHCVGSGLLPKKCG